MAAFVDSKWIGPRSVRATEAQLEIIDNFDRGLGDVGRANLERHAHYFQIRVPAPAVPNNNTVNGIQEIARVPFKVVAIEAGASGIAGTSFSVDLVKDPAGGTSYATMLETAPSLLAAAAGTVDKGEVLDSAEDVAEGSSYRVQFTGAGAGAVDGAFAILHCFRL